jgi:hypothetical protein
VRSHFGLLFRIVNPLSLGVKAQFEPQYNIGANKPETQQAQSQYCRMWVREIAFIFLHERISCREK